VVVALAAFCLLSFHRRSALAAGGWLLTYHAAVVLLLLCYLQDERGLDDPAKV
jgi:hypothetical protein